MKIYLHQTHQTIADFSAILQNLKSDFSSSDQQGLHLYPELFLTGYPLQDMCLQKPFIAAYEKMLTALNQWSMELSKDYSSNDLCILLGGLKYNLTSNSEVKQIKNVIYKLLPGKEIEAIYTKQLLPNYDIFDEKKYYSPGEEAQVLLWNDKKIGLLICEDMWASNLYKIDPCLNLKNKIEKENIDLDLIINLSASPYNIQKQDKRVQRAMTISQNLAAPFAYVNRIGGEDEILFDGSSFIVNRDQLVTKGKMFTPDLICYEIEDLPPSSALKRQSDVGNESNTWEDLFSAQIEESTKKNELPKLSLWDDTMATEVLNALIFGLQEYANKCGFKKFTIALSGGMDSALTLAIVRLSLREGQSLEAIYMPGLFSAGLSFDLAYKQCQKLGIKLNSMPIKFLHSTCRNQFKQTFSEPFDGLADENIQSRLRGALLYARSNQSNSMVINTSNKSELAVGYSTLYGDSVGAISLLGDLYKTEVYRLADLINKLYPDMIPQEVIDRPPSAELRKDQLDSHSLPPYERLDAILEMILSFRFTEEDIIEKGFSQEEVLSVSKLYHRSEFKRFQFCPIIKIRPKSFGFGYRIPICKSSAFYHNQDPQ